MARRKAHSILDDARDLFTDTPFWAGPVVAGVVFLLVLLVFPLLLNLAHVGQFDFGKVLRPMVPWAAYGLGAITLVGWAGAELTKFRGKFRGRRRFDAQTGLESIRKLSWAAFEQLIVEAYRRQGYAVEHTGSACGDGGVDLVLCRTGQTKLVQCKQWKVFRVGVRPVRELFGVVTARKAQQGIIITSGQFTPGAKQFAQANSIELIDGVALAQMIAPLRQNGGRPKITAREESSPPRQAPAQGEQGEIRGPVPDCPSCGQAMVLRTARKGENVGSQFWGCPSYPKCRGTRPVN